MTFPVITMSRDIPAKYFPVSGPPKIHYQNLPKVVQRVNKLTISETQGLALSVKKTS
jgi:hypothetical protein